MRPVILDMDPGVDDALAIVLALNSPEIEVMGVSVVSGNVPLEDCARNAMQVLELLERQDMPVYVGAGRPLVREPVYAFEVHGERGLGEAELPEPDMMPLGDATSFMIESINARPGEVTLVATGPLTNLAIAEARAPGILQQARRVIAMGGALQEPGNITPMSEFNFHVDPHAARNVLMAGANMTLLPLGVTRQVTLEEAAIQQRALSDSPRVQFCADAARTVIDFGKRLYGRDSMALHDPLAVALAIDPEICETEIHWLDVETEGQLVAGQVVVDRRPFIDDGDRVGAEVECAMRANTERVLALFTERVLG